VLIFDEDKIKELKKMHKPLDQEKVKAASPDLANQPEKEETNTQLVSEGGVAYEGSRVCGFIIE
jgi:cytochrome c556